MERLRWKQPVSGLSWCVLPLDEAPAGRGSHPDLTTFEQKLGMDLRAQGPPGGRA